MKNFNSSVARRRKSPQLRQRRSSATTNEAEGFTPKTTKVKGSSWTVFLGLCKGCGLCLEKCPAKAIIFSPEKGIYNKPAPKVVPDKCNLCGICETICPDCAIRVDKK